MSFRGINYNDHSYLGDCSEEQLLCLNSLKATLQVKSISGYDDEYLLRFCRARKFDYKKVEKMFLEFI